MAIVTIGKLVLQVGTGLNREEHLRGLLEEMREAVKEVIGRCIEAELEQEVDRALQRKAHRRSKRVSSGVKGKAVFHVSGAGNTYAFHRERIRRVIRSEYSTSRDRNNLQFLWGVAGNGDDIVIHKRALSKLK